MTGPMQGGVIGVLIYEGLAKNEEEAVALAESGEIDFAPFGAGFVRPSLKIEELPPLFFVV